MKENYENWRSLMKALFGSQDQRHVLTLNAFGDSVFFFLNGNPFGDLELNLDAWGGSESLDPFML